MLWSGRRAQEYKRLSGHAVNRSPHLVCFTVFRMWSSLRFSVVVAALSFPARSLCGTIGPVTDLTIVNKDIAPDGYRRAAVLAGGTFPGPLITGKKVCINLLALCVVTPTDATSGRTTISTSM